MIDSQTYRQRLNMALGVTLCCSLTIVAAGVLAIIGDRAPRTNFYDVAYVALAVTVAARMMLHLRIGQTRITQSLIDATVMLGLIRIGWPWLVIAVAVGVTVGRCWARAPWRWVIFTATRNVIVVSVAAYAGTLAGLGQPPVRATPHHLVGLFLVAGVMLLTEECLTIPARALADEQSVRAVFTSTWHIRIGSSIIRLLLAIVAGYFLPHIALAMPIAIAGLQLAYANHVQQRSDRLAWQRLAKLSDTLSASDGDALRHAAVLGAAELFSCDEVDLELPTGGGHRWLLRASTTEITYSGPVDAAPTTRGMLVSATLESHEPGPTKPGELRLRFHGTVPFSEREHYTLRALAAALGTAIRKASAVSETARMVSYQAHAAMHDEITGLANRRHLLEAGTEAARRGPVGLIVLYLGQFQQISDAFSSAVGDGILREVGQRLTAALPAHSDDLVARLAGSEFAVMLTDLTQPAMAMVTATDLIARIAAPMEIGASRLEVGATAGVAVGGDGTIDELLRRAEVAMYQAQDQGDAILLYARTRDTTDTGRLAFTADIARAVAERQFTIAFQPIVDLTSGMVVSAEALARWHHPQRGAQTPDSFLDAIERSGLLAPFTLHVLDLALAGARQWRDAGFHLPVAVNISPRSLLDPAFPESIPQALARHDLPPEALMIELTETLTLSHLEVVDDVLQSLRTLGVTLALDDFGTGYSTLATLARVPVHELKIDRTFVSELDGAAQAAIIRTTIDLGRSLDLLVVAEGIETDAQRERLWSLGCAAGQGHLFGHPMSPEAFIDRLREGNDGVAGRLVAPIHETGTVIRLPVQRRAQSVQTQQAQASGASGRHAAAPPPIPHTRPDTAGNRIAMPE